jgi:hypothetical protein
MLQGYSPPRPWLLEDRSRAVHPVGRRNGREIDGSTNVIVDFEPKQLPCVTSNYQTKPLTTAKRYIQSENCVLGKITWAYAPRLKRGYVISRDLKAYWRRLHGIVNLVASKGKKP